MNFNYSEIKKAAKKYKADEKDHRLAVLGDSATQLLSQCITGMGVTEGFPLNVFDADYDQILLQSFDDNSELYAFNPDSVLIFMCTQKLFEEYCRFGGDKKDFAEVKAREIADIHKKIHTVSGANVLQFTFLTDNDSVFGNFGTKLRNSFVFQLYKLNMLLMETAADSNYTYLIDLNNVRCCSSAEEFSDEKMYYTAKLAISVNGLADTAYNVLSVIKSLKGIQKKCVICDLDNTLWGGVIGDDGMDNIEIGELGSGRAFTHLQMWLKELKNRGIILCVCSKNNEDTAKEPFEKHPDMVLRLDDIAVFVANWENKAQNIQHIRDILNIGMDSMVFLDDNPFERDLVRSLIPEITVPDLPKDPSCYCSYLKSLDLFETISYSENDAARTEQYKAEFKRSELMSDTGSFEDYLKGLEMVAEYGGFVSHYYPRIAQLTQRSNQFNLRTVRYTEADIQSIAESDNYVTLYFTLKDKFGSYGLVGVVIMEKKNDSLFIDTLLMSCRVLKRGMEEFIFNAIVETAKKAGFDKIEAEYIPTKKNKMVSGLYKQFGFTETTTDHYTLNVNEYEHRDNAISC